MHFLGKVLSHTKIQKMQPRCFLLELNNRPPDLIGQPQKFLILIFLLRQLVFRPISLHNRKHVIFENPIVVPLGQFIS